MTEKTKLMGYATPSTVLSGTMISIEMPIEMIEHLAIAKYEDISYRQVIEAVVSASRKLRFHGEI